MSLRFGIWVLVFAAAVLPLGAGTTPADLIFEVKGAVKMQNPTALEKCFYLKGAETSMKASIKKVIDEICGWPDPHITMSQRTGSGPLETEINGHPHELNGDWTFQIHIHKSKPPSRGFVLPAGMTPDGRCAILVSIPK